MKCKHPDRHKKDCVFSDESGNQCVHCETLYFEARPGTFEGQTQAEWEASRGRDSSICNADYWNREYRKQGSR